MTLSGSFFKTMQGNNVVDTQGSTQLAEDDNLPSADARYGEAFNEFMGDDLTDDFFRNSFVYDPNAQKDYLDPSFLNSKDSSKDQQLSQINDHIINNNNGDNDFIAFAQYDLGGVVTPSGPVNIKSEINHYDQSVGGADIADERAEVEQPRANVSLDEKRRRATVDNGDSSEVIGRIGNDRVVSGPSTAQPKTIKTSKRAKSSTPLESIEDPDTMQATTVQSPARTHVSKVLASERPLRPSRRQSLAAADYTDVKVADGGVKGMTFAEAQEMFTSRRALDIDGSDDVNEVKAEPEKWILAIMQAFDQAYSQTPNTPTFNKDLIPEFEDDEAKPNITLTDSEAEADDADDDDDRPAKKRKTGKDHKKDRADEKRAKRIERSRIEALVDAHMELEAPSALASSSKAGQPLFRYRETSPNSFGLTPRDILLAPSDAALNEFVGLKKLATFRDEDKKRKDKKKLGKKARLRQWRRDNFGKEFEETGPTFGFEGNDAPLQESELPEKKKKKRKRKGKASAAP